MNHFRERIRRLRTGLMAFLLMLGSMFGVLTPAMQAYAAEPTITGTCHIEVDDLGANTGGSEPYTTFFVTMPDGQTYHGECIDHGSYIPLAGDYPFTGTWNGTSYDIIVESRYFADTREDVCPEERPNFDLYGQGYTQRVGNFTYMPYGYVRIVKQSADPALTDGNAMYSLAGAEFTVTSQDGSVLGVLTTGEDGTTGTLEVPAGQTVTIRETKPPEGFLPAAEQAVAITTQETRTGIVTVTATQSIGGLPLDPAQIQLVYTDGCLTQLSGTLYLGTLSRPSSQTCLVCGEALIAFLGSRDVLGWVADQVYAVEQCYTHAGTASAATVRLDPSWKITTDTGYYLVNGITGAVTIGAA